MSTKIWFTLGSQLNPTDQALHYNVFHHLPETTTYRKPLQLHITTRFIERYGYITIKQKALEQDRQEAENLETITEYFQKLQETITTHAIQPADLWNMDETGFCIGVGKDQLVVTRRRKRASYLGIPQNRESATAIEAISAGGQYLPAFLILTGQVHMSRWYQVKQLEGDTYISLSLIGYSNDKLSLQ